MQSGREDTLEEQYAIRFYFKLDKNATETYGIFRIAFGASCMNRASLFEWHQRFKEGRGLWGMMRGVRGVRKSIDQSWLAKGLGLLCWGFKGVQEEITSEVAIVMFWPVGPAKNAIQGNAPEGGDTFWWQLWEEIAWAEIGWWNGTR